MSFFLRGLCFRIGLAAAFVMVMAAGAAAMSASTDGDSAAAMPSNAGTVCGIAACVCAHQMPAQ
jgi:hypothetical protein